ncbi:FadR/GntR family transcriptional regulator [Natribacillus halophilus]|uniref:GntR family transcriptional regulator, transcriptional repressor for pyruvate dehydrogenase complex n=1 Tax=Natribacillus halophilus TaxID=549003 RepID=A0A1G8JWA7_9BACI|nr:FadR/GntR family transcriptional regulator [Natribacillus halophilus]SDI35435.1 GntR family transcriptional regulator, transcriptional repressor for pyruvate dehydrogenase complex [Natribacillus halophilus]
MKIERKKVSMQVFDHIKKMIDDHELKPGDKLPTESYFTELFGVSRTPIREALSVLEASGLITSTQGGGSVIQPISASDLMEETRFEFMDPLEVVDLLETRMIIESGAAYFAAKRRAPADLENIQQALVHIRDTQSEEKIGHEEDIHFHKVIVEASHNPVLIQTMASISNLYDKAVKFSLAKNLGWKEKRQQVLQEHEDIYAAVEKKEPENARQAMIKHLENAKTQACSIYLQ